MNDFQVGDRVRTIVGTVAETPSCFKVAVDYGDGSGLAIYHTDYIELVERPKRKLRVGSVWERTLDSGLSHRYLAINGKFDFYKLCACEQDQFPQGELLYRSNVCFDDGSYRWREVPVEELEREAQ